MKQSNSLLQQNFLVCKLIITYQVYISIDVLQHVLPWWQLRAYDNRYFIFSFHYVFLS